MTDLNRPDLMDLVGERVTVTDTGPARTNTWTGTLAVLANQPSLMLDLDDGRRVVLLQYRCKVTRADGTRSEPTPHPIPALLSFPGQQPLHVTAHLGVDPAYTDGTKPEEWWADLHFHPFGPPTEDAECTLDLGGTIGRGRIPAGSTRMLGDGPPPTIRCAGGPYPELEIAPWERQFLDQGTLATVPPSEPAPTEPGHGGNVAQLLERQLDRLAATLNDSLANLDAHIEQRAQELAQPLIDEARAAADDEISSAQGMQQRAEDLVAELRRQLKALDWENQTARQARDTAKAAIARVRAIHQPEQPPEGHQWLSGGREPKCRGCDHEGNPFTALDWPCPTIRALDGEEANRG